jgi:hypothetical protein
MKRGITTIVVVALAGLLPAASASAAPAPGAQRLHLQAGPYKIVPGANQILTDINGVPKPSVDGYVTRISPNLHFAKADGSCCGAIPRVDVIHLHHGVWLTNAREPKGGYGFAGFHPFFAAGEEKTIFTMPRGFGWAVKRTDAWVLNYMIHNLTPVGTQVYITYDVDVVPATAPQSRSITPVHPVWMDVQAGHIYPVFNVKRHSGRNGTFTYPNQAANPYGGRPLNEQRITQPGTLITTAGHVHPGGLWTQLDLSRPGASVSAASRRRGVTTGTAPDSVRLFRSMAHYWDPRGPISWDMAMGATAADWRVRVRAGDTLRVSATYETQRASWYEAMGIMVVYMTYDSDGKGRAAGVDPMVRAANQAGHVTHGHLAENNHHGGSRSLGVNALRYPNCPTTAVAIRNYRYRPGDFKATGAERCAPAVPQGSSLTFTNFDASSQGPGNFLFPSPAYRRSAFHTITACQNPCGLDTGISYPLANGPGNYDSAQLGFGTPAADRLTWSTPTRLKTGSYTYYCRIHPFMRGTFRVVHG